MPVGHELPRLGEARERFVLEHLVVAFNEVMHFRFKHEEGAVDPAFAGLRLFSEAGNAIAVEFHVAVARRRPDSCDCRQLLVGAMEGEKLVGIFTERDYSRKVILKGKSSRNTSVRELMTPDPITVTPDTTIEDCMQLMTNKFIRHLPVVESDHVVGVISIGDVVRYIIEEQRHTIESLEHYITGR